MTMPNADRQSSDIMMVVKTDEIKMNKKALREARRRELWFVVCAELRSSDFCSG
jgi:hypothetical protein